MDEQTAKVISITSRLENPLTKPILYFLAHVLPSMDRFSRLFQKSNENTTCELYVQMGRLVRLYAGNLLKKEVINPQRACAQRVTVVLVSLTLSACARGLQWEPPLIKLACHVSQLAGCKSLLNS